MGQSEGPVEVPSNGTVWQSDGPAEIPSNASTPRSDVLVSVRSVLEDEPLLVQKELTVDEEDEADEAVEETAPVLAPAAKVFFLDGIRGLAAILVVTQHSHEYMQDLNLGAIAVDSFFVLSSFLLTWLFMRKSIRLLDARAGARTWLFAVADYLSRRFFRVYPLFAITCIVLWCMTDADKDNYYLVKGTGSYDLLKTLTFEFHHRYHVFWTLPLEITYYFIIPVFVLVTLALRKFWWVPFVPAYCWVVYEGWNEYRTSHAPFRPHIPTFLAGSMAAVIFLKLDTWMKANEFEFRLVHKVVLRAIEFTAIALFLSIAFRGLFFIWVHANIAPTTPGFPFTSVLLTIIIVSEMLLPSSVSSVFGWSVLRHWGKISFSVYLLHTFVISNKSVNHQSNYYCRLFSRFGLICVLATTSYYVVEYPSQLVAKRVTKALSAQEAKGYNYALPSQCDDDAGKPADK
ncbi:unnamed protein product [Hyaloperonospora brassicae]|uniref:Acyltransferase 3 domain-containing protein n=1 Tax=Hyaloperonospora brassicae TaxID=162125 RepID=A0AAV0U9G3_HYABA|nr:unnamed protein product [Hyaloperonospora brassicae]